MAPVWLLEVNMKLDKYEFNPILKPNPNNDWENLCVLNPAVIYDEKEKLFKMIYRAAGNDETHYIYLGLAVSEDGFHFKRVFDHPVLSPDFDGPDGGCVEDPRLFKLDDYYYLTYASRTFPPGQYWKEDKKYYGFQPKYGPTMLINNNSISYLAISKDLKTFKKLGRISDSRVDDRDDVIFFNSKLQKFVKLSRPVEYVGPEYGCKTSSIWISFSDDLLEWGKPTLLYEGHRWWEDKKTGASTNVIETEYGFLFTYHGVSTKDDNYRIGAMMLDKDDPTKILAITNNPILEPELEYETSGFYNGCVFPCSIVVKDNLMYWYYGTADKFVCVATTAFNQFIDQLMKGEL